MDLHHPQSASSTVRLPIRPLPQPLPTLKSPITAPHPVFLCIVTRFSDVFELFIVAWCGPSDSKHHRGRDLRHRGWQPLEILGACRENTSPGTSAVWVCSSVAPRPFYRQSRGIHRPWSLPSDPWRSAPNAGDKNVIPEQWRDCHKYEVWHKYVRVRVSAHTLKV